MKKKSLKDSKPRRSSSKQPQTVESHGSSQSFSTQFHGSVFGPVATGSGDLIIEKLDYGVGDKDAFNRLTAILEGTEKSLKLSVLNIASKLSAQNQRDTSVLLEYVGKNPLSSEETRKLISVVKQVLRTSDKKFLSNGGVDKSAETIGDALESPNLGVEHKLKLSIPIIPLFLQYEGEINIDNKLNLEKLWDWLQAKLHRKFSRER